MLTPTRKYRYFYCIYQCHNEIEHGRQLMFKLLYDILNTSDRGIGVNTDLIVERKFEMSDGDKLCDTFFFLFSLKEKTNLILARRHLSEDELVPEFFH